MLAEIENRLMLNQIRDFTLEECEDRIMLLHYLLRRGDMAAYQEELQDYLLKIEQQVAKLTTLQDS